MSEEDKKHLYPSLSFSAFRELATLENTCLLNMHFVSDTLHTFWSIPVDLVTIGEVNVSIDRKGGMESSHVVSKEESSEDTVAVEEYVTLVNMSGNEAPVAVYVVVVICGRESSVGLGKTKVGDTVVPRILLHAYAIVGLGWTT